ncbi:hypothetical protein C8Q76DRAFT_697894 [Earliella scabrosa]|nr:hypothetical protein C8Q76DRAFT_697894 [Earliella scabrosa]
MLFPFLARMSSAVDDLLSCALHIEKSSARNSGYLSKPQGCDEDPRSARYAEGGRSLHREQRPSCGSRTVATPNWAQNSVAYAADAVIVHRTSVRREWGKSLRHFIAANAPRRARMIVAHPSNRAQMPGCSIYLKPNFKSASSLLISASVSLPAAWACFCYVYHFLSVEGGCPVLTRQKDGQPPEREGWIQAEVVGIFGIAIHNHELTAARPR